MNKLCIISVINSNEEEGESGLNTASSAQLIQLRHYKRKKYWRTKQQQSLKWAIYPFFVAGVCALAVATLLVMMATDLFLGQAYTFLFHHPALGCFFAAVAIGSLWQWGCAWIAGLRPLRKASVQHAGKTRIRLAISEK